MKDIVNSFKAIMANKLERVEFIGGFACVLIMLAAMYLCMVIFQSGGLLK